jgi:hypothetical protein
MGETLTSDYKMIDGALIAQTLVRLQARIKERFPSGNLQHVCATLTDIANSTVMRADQLRRPNLFVRMAVGFVIVMGIGFALFATSQLHLNDADFKSVSVVSTLESLVNLGLLMAAAIFSLVTLETRLKQKDTLKALHELRSIIHVIDMHQLTKDPSVEGETALSSSPLRDMNSYALVRYLDYCSEMLSLAAKLAALYAQDISDLAVVDAASDIEQLATNLSQKVWQKITILQTRTKTAEPASPMAS